MKKLLLLISSLSLGFISNAQVSITGSSLNYNQNFNSLNITSTTSNSLPNGWQIYEKGSGIAADQMYVGDIGSSNAGNTYSYGAAANTERALGSVASGTVLPQFGVRFINNTTVDITSFSIAHKVEQWRLGNITTHNDSLQFYYSTTATGVNDTVAIWTEVPSLMVNSVLTSGTATGAVDGNTNSITKNGNVTVTVVAGGTLVIKWVDKNITGSDDGLGIDDIAMSFTTITPPPPSYNPNIVYFTPSDNSANQSLSTNLIIAFDRHITQGTGSIHIKNENSGSIQNIQANSANVIVNNDTATITGLSLTLGSTYHILVDSTAFDTAGYHTFGIYDTTSWNFSTLPLPVTSISETFDAACAANQIPLNWTKQNITGPGQQWGCNPGTGTNKNYYITGYVNGTYFENEDWLFTPSINLSSANNPILFFRGYQRYGVDHHLDVLYSTNFSGTGNPNLATWTNLNIDINSPADTGSWKDYSASLPTNNPMYIAFKYSSSTTIGALVRIDSVVVTSTSGILPVKGNNQLPVSVLGASSHNSILVGFVVEKPSMVTTEVFDLTGRVVYSNVINAVNGTNRISLNTPELPSGLYIVRVSNGYEYGVVKAVIE